MKFIYLAAITLSVAATTARAQLPVDAVDVRVDSSVKPVPIPADYSGVAFEASMLLPQANGKPFFNASDTALLRTFANLGVRSIRIGGNMVDAVTQPDPTHEQIDTFFAFAKAAHVHVIYTLRLKNQTDPAEAAKYIADHYGDLLTCQTIGNEPANYFKTYPAYAAAWKSFEKAILAASPTTVFGGPGAANDGKWVGQMVSDFQAGGHFVLVTEHDYVGGDGFVAARHKQEAIDFLLSPKAHRAYAHMRYMLHTGDRSLPFRLEEVNSYYHGGAAGVTDTQAAALWCLDYLHWWAVHGAGGINLQSGDFVAADQKLTRCNYTPFLTASGGYEIKPTGVAMKAFDLAGHGETVATICTPAVDTLRVYATRSTDGTLFETLINMSHGPSGRDVDVRVDAPGFARVIRLHAPAIYATSGLKLGDAPVAANGEWAGQWSEVAGSTVHVAAGEAAVVRFDPTR